MSKHSVKKLIKEEGKVDTSSNSKKDANFKKLKIIYMLLSLALSLGVIGLPLIIIFFPDFGNMLGLGEALIVISTVLIAAPLVGMIVVGVIMRKKYKGMNNLPPGVPSNASQHNVLACNDYMHKLTELARMYRDGLLTKEEFDQAKKKII
jgi:Na+(H+)/acetate symporter ActP